ncbi:MAG: TlpA disulfide reductase family protein [Anaerolineae bacterium]
MRRTIVLGALLVIGVAWILPNRITEMGLPAAQARAAQKGLIAPEIQVPRLGGGELSLREMEGQIIVLNFWATWCPPCRAEMPALERVYEERSAEGLVVIGINQMEPEAQVQAFVEEFGLTFPIGLDLDGSVSQAYRARALPMTYFIDRQGTIRDIVVGGPMSEALLRSKIDELMK